MHERDLSRSAAGRLIRSGGVFINERVGRASDPVHRGDVVTFVPAAPRISAVAGEEIPLHVIHEDSDLLVIDKPAGMVVHPAAGHWSGTLVHALLGRGGDWSSAGGENRPGIVHRLDKGTSGLLVVARTDAAYRSLAEQLATHELGRTYLAVVRGVMEHEAGVLEGDIGRDPGHRQRMAVVARGRFARTRYRVREKLRGYSLLQCELETGRTHQIRVHLAALRHPIAGDRQYSSPRSDEPSRPALHSWQLRLRHPSTGELMRFKAPPPDDFASFLRSLGSSFG